MGVQNKIYLIFNFIISFCLHIIINMKFIKKIKKNCIRLLKQQINGVSQWSSLDVQFVYICNYLNTIQVSRLTSKVYAM